MKLVTFMALFGGLLVCANLPAATNDAPLTGFDPASAVQERALEARFDAALRAEDLREWMRRLTAHPHHLGSPYDKTNAEFIAAQFRSWGYQTRIEQFDVLFPTPLTRLLELVEPTRFTANLVEPPLPEDATSGLTAEQLPVYHAYSPDGDVTGKLVYVNQGLPKDYEVLAERGIDVTGRVVIARYGGSWRGIKPKVAAEHGAIGCIIYSDPRDDGYFQGDVYPNGPWRNDRGAQRGSVADLPLYPGDPLTPGVGATKDAKRLPMGEAASLAKIPVLPIASADALPLLRALTGPVAPESWRGALPLTYHLGPGLATVHLKLEFDWKTVPAYDVVATLKGSECPDQWIIRGNHHDAWVCGAEDPVSGTVTLLEEARVLAALAGQGWKPRRTILFTVWDGEEPGLLGSTEWAETHAEELKKKAAVYINSDSNTRGTLGAEGSHSLERFVDQIARDVRDPEKNVSVAERKRAVLLAKAGATERAELRAHPGLRLEACGSGSDYTPFLQHLGIASLNLGYESKESGGSYHSIYDSFDYYTRFCDTNSEYGLVLARTTGRAVLRLANADVLPFEPSDLGDTVAKYVAEVLKLADDLRAETKETNLLLRDHTLALAADPNQPFVAPAPKSEVPFLNFAPLQNALEKVRQSAREFDQARPGGWLGCTPESRQALDGVLMSLEHSLTRPEGLPRRPWYQHLVYAPGFYTGYSVKTLPGVREAIELRHWSEAAEQIDATAAALERFAAQLDRARATLSIHKPLGHDG
jgi:N-acetylated-alpha-linked acidic dipeptidase